MAKKAYECDRCNEVHLSYFEAETCCPHEVLTVFLCDHCEESHEDEEDANKCCADRSGTGELVVCPSCFRGHDLDCQVIAIEVAGHCSTCNPFYSIEDQLKIDDRVIEEQAERIERHLWGLPPKPLAAN